MLMPIAIIGEVILNFAACRGNEFAGGGDTRICGGMGGGVDVSMNVVWPNAPIPPLRETAATRHCQAHLLSQVSYCFQSSSIIFRCSSTGNLEMRNVFFM